MTISILGCGWYGRALGKELLNCFFTVKASCTDAVKLNQLADIGLLPYLINIHPDHELIVPDFFKCDILVICIPPKFRQGQTGVYLEKIESIIRLIKDNSIAKVIYISSTAVYGNVNREVNESDPPEPDDEHGRILMAAENLFKVNTCSKTTIIRFGGLIGPGRDPGRFFTGKMNIPNGLAPVNLIHLCDCVGITTAIITKENIGAIFNAVMPFHPDKASFYANASLKAGLPEPSFVQELTSWKIVNSLNLNLLLNYQFKYAGPEISDLKAGYNI